MERREAPKQAAAIDLQGPGGRAAPYESPNGGGGHRIQSTDTIGYEHPAVRRMEEEEFEACIAEGDASDEATARGSDRVLRLGV